MQSIVRVHDHYQLELKLTHPLAGANPVFEMWFFFPGSLGIDEPRFQKDEFYADLTAYTRFRTPRIGLDRLLADPESPLAWVERHAPTSGSAPAGALVALDRKLRLFAAIYRASLRDASAGLAACLRPGTPVEVFEENVAAAANFVRESKAVLGRFRGVHPSVRDPQPTIDAACHAVDDFISLHAIEAWFGLLALVQPSGSAPGASDGLVVDLRAAIDGETAYRTATGLLGAPLDDPGANEPYITRVNHLKKWVLGVLHLRLVSNRRAERAREFAFSLAAAVAMTVAVGLQLVAMWTVGTPTVPELGRTLYTFIGLAVGGYILKDGIKDRLKTWFQAGIPHWLFDRRFDLSVGSGEPPFGAVEETVTLLELGDVAAPVIALRETGEDPLFRRERAEEDVVHYRRRVQLNAPLARAAAPEMAAVDEIIRFNVRRWLRRMDEPVRPLSRLDPGGRVERVEAAKTYRVTLVISHAEGGHLERAVVVVSRDGLVRIERA